MKMRKLQSQLNNENNDDAYGDGWRCVRWWMTMRMKMDDEWRGRWRYTNDEDDAGEPADPAAGDDLLAAERHLSQQPLSTATQGTPTIDISIYFLLYKYASMWKLCMAYSVMCWALFRMCSVYQFSKDFLHMCVRIQFAYRKENEKTSFTRKFALNTKQNLDLYLL